MFIEGRHQHAQCAEDQTDMDVDAQPKAVEHRHTAEQPHAALCVKIQRLKALHGEGVEVEIGQTDTLGKSRGAAAVEDDRGTIFFKRFDPDGIDCISALQEILI